MFVHKKFSWTLVDQSLGRSAIEWFCVDIDGCKIVNVYKPPTSQLTLTAIPEFPYLCLYAGDFNCQHIDWGYNYITHTENAWLTRQPREIFPSCITLKMPPASLVARTLEPMLTWLLQEGHSIIIQQIFNEFNTTISQIFFVFIYMIHF